MPTFQRCPPAIKAMADEILREHESHQQVVSAKVEIDYVFAFADVNDAGVTINNALTHHGSRALGICKKIALKERVLGRGDVEIALDGRWWQEASEAECRAVLDHELHHIEVKVDLNGVCRDDIGRPLIKLRKHDYDVGWFNIIAQRHGTASIEAKQAKQIMDEMGQYYWPELFEASTGLRSPSTPAELVRAIDRNDHDGRGATTFRFGPSEYEAVKSADKAMRVARDSDGDQMTPEMSEANECARVELQGGAK
jgi:hypothetical protein